MPQIEFAIHLELTGGYREHAEEIFADQAEALRKEFGFEQVKLSSAADVGKYLDEPVEWGASLTGQVKGENAAEFRARLEQALNDRVESGRLYAAQIDDLYEIDD